MRRELKFRKRAQLDLIEHGEYIRIDNPEAADRFLQKARETLESLLRMPKMGRERPQKRSGLNVIRFIPVKEFEKYLIFYRPTARKISVIRILHSARDINRLLGF